MCIAMGTWAQEGILAPEQDRGSKQTTDIEAVLLKDPKSLQIKIDCHNKVKIKDAKRNRPDGKAKRKVNPRSSTAVTSPWI